MIAVRTSGRRRCLALGTMSLVLAVGLALGLAGCGGGSPGAPVAAPSASDPACAALLTRLPATLLGRAETSGGSAQTGGSAGTAVWGDPAIVLQCGVTPPGPTTAECVTVDEVDWIFTEDQDAYHFVTFGRTPAVSLTVPVAVDRASAPGTLAQLAAAVKPLPVSRHCIGGNDVPSPPSS